ncbi:hypothetical protein ACT8ZV_09355 [Nocardioides sp. MAHUQ-72]|uniref:hypothetical protein n=1 Tax=unclassified Nocardioides TaxID=2615069 RepID=UPI00360A3CF9
MTGTHTRPSPAAATVTATRRRLSRLAHALEHDRVLQTALAMIVVQLAFRAWATYGSWFHYDDLNFMSRMMNEGPGLDVAARQYSGHVMPAAMYLSWLANAVAPFDFRVTATMLMAMQALADAGLLVLLVRLFGLRRGILPPLALYLFCAISVPIAVWWAAGANQLPLQVVLFWGLASHVSYLRTRRRRHLVSTAGWLLLGFCFYEKTLLVFGAIAIVSLCYFATGSLLDRLRLLWQHYRPAICLYVAMGIAYLALYVRIGLTFEPERAGSDALGAVISNMTIQAYLPALAGGPLHWEELEQGGYPTPSGPVLLVSILVVLYVVRELARHRRRSMRALWLPGFFLACNIVLVLAGRASYVGALISLDYRYQGELAAVTAVALACAAMPIRGAVETVERTGTSPLLDVPHRVTGLVAAVSALGLVSSAQYAVHWQEAAPAKSYFATLFRELDAAPGTVSLVDQRVPTDVMFGLGYPENALSHLLHDDPGPARFVDVATDHLSMVDSHGRVVPAIVPDTRRGRPGPRKECGFRVGDQPVTIRLDGPVAYGGWWVRIGYIATGDSPVRITTGDVTHTTTVEAGLHALYLAGGGRFDEIEVSALAEGVSLCTDDVTVGRPVPRTEFAP